MGDLCLIALKKEFSSFSYNFEKYYHLLLEIKTGAIDQAKLKFDIKIDFEGFEGVLFYIYCPSPKLMKFDLLLNVIKSSQYIEDLFYFPRLEGSYEFLDFIIVPFGQLHHDNELAISVKINNHPLKYKSYAWVPSSLYKNVKSVIRIDNYYNQLKINPSKKYNYSYLLGNWFKVNETNLLLSLINSLVNYEFKCEMEPDVEDLKNIVHRANEFLFELSEETEKALLKNIILEVKRLRNLINVISKEEIIQWINDIINYYSDKILRF